MKKVIITLLCTCLLSVTASFMEKRQVSRNEKGNNNTPVHLPFIRDGELHGEKAGEQE